MSPPADASKYQKSKAMVQNRAIFEQLNEYMKSEYAGFRKLVSMLDKETYGDLRSVSDFHKEVSSKSDLFKLFDRLETLYMNRAFPDILSNPQGNYALHSQVEIG